MSEVMCQGLIDALRALKCDSVSGVRDFDELGVGDEFTQSVRRARTYQDVLIGLDDQRRELKMGETFSSVVAQDGVQLAQGRGFDESCRARGRGLLPLLVVVVLLGLPAQIAVLIKARFR